MLSVFRVLLGLQYHYIAITLLADHFAEAITDQFVGAGKELPVLGLLNLAIGGSMIEEWMENDVVSRVDYRHSCMITNRHFPLALAG